MKKRAFAAAALAQLVTCGGTAPVPPGGTPTPVRWFHAETTDRTFRAADAYLAAIEMQVSGEPFAGLIGRDVAGYNRYSATSDEYIDPATMETRNDPLGYSLAVESYEYSKMVMNMTSFESGGGLSLQFGPVLNPTGEPLDPAYVGLRDRLQKFARASNAGGIKGSNVVISPAPADNPLNVYGWPGYWPVFAEFDAFHPEITPFGGAVRGCSFVGGYAAAAMGAQLVGDYECGYNSLNLADREQAVTKTLSPTALGFSAWKQGLWVINYWQALHDAAGNVITDVAPADLKDVGVQDNGVVGRYADPANPDVLLDGYPGVYLGDNALEGWQGLTMIEELDNKAAFLLSRLLTSDGKALSGFGSVKEAMTYSDGAPLRWFPSRVAVTELSATGPPPPAAWKYFPQPDLFTIQAPESRLRDLIALAGGFAQLYALTDGTNAEVGGLPGPLATFDGDPFPLDDPHVDGEETAHDRALALIRLAVIDLDRLHRDPGRDVLVSTTSVSGGAILRGSVVDTVDTAYAIVALRAALRSVTSTLTLYSNDTPDTAGVGGAFGDRIRNLITAEADFLAGALVGPDGAVANGYDLAADARDPAPTRIEAEAGAIRGLLEAYLATGDDRYRQVAMRVFDDLDRRFWMIEPRAYRARSDEIDTFTWTPLAFGTLQGALRQYWKLVGMRPGQDQLAAELLERIQRINKLLLNGWDDANGDNRLTWPDECTGAGLQMAERALTGELSLATDGPDRDHDCVPEIAAAGLPAVLASQVVLHR